VRPPLRSPLIDRAGAAGFAFALLLVATAAGQSPSPLARYVPKDNLTLYVEYKGLDAQADAWRKTAAYKILNETTTGAMLEDLFVQVVGKVPNARLSGPEALALLKHVARSGFVLAVGRGPGKDKADYTVVVLRDAYKVKEIRPIAVRVIQGMNRPGSKMQAAVRAGHRVASGTNVHGDTFTFWVEDSKKDDLVVVTPSAESPDFILETLDGKRPSAVDHPLRVELEAPESGFLPTGLGFVEPSVLRQVPAADLLGLTDVKRLDHRWGFQDDALMGITRVSAPAPRKGVLAMLDGPSFEKGALPPLPDTVTDFTVTSVDLKGSLDKLIAVARPFKPDIEDRVNKVADTIKAKTKLRLREDILGRLGPRAAWYVAPAKANAPATLAAPNMVSLMLATAGIDQIPRAALVMDVDDPAAFGKVLDEVMAYANREIKAQMARAAGGGDAAGGGRRNRPSGPTFEFRPSPGEVKTFTLNVPNEMAGLVPASLRPTIRIVGKSVAVAVNPEVARAALEVKGGWNPPANLAAGFAGLPSKLKFLSISDPGPTTPAVLASLPAKLQAGINNAIIQAKGQGQPPMAGNAAPAPAAPPPSALPRPGLASGGSGGGATSSPSAPGGGPMGGPDAARPGEAAGTIVLQVDPAKLPSADAIKKLLFPSILAAEVNDDGLRIITRSAFPALGDPGKANGLMQMYKAAAARARLDGGAMPAPPPTGPAGGGSQPKRGTSEP